MRAPRLRLRFPRRVCGRGVEGEGAERFGGLLVEVLELLELEALYRSLKLLLKVKLFFYDIVN